jgi:probable blue pigment (indigoidine) exporter
MTRRHDLLLTALAPAVWGSTYLVTTELLPAGYPLTMAMLRALPAGLLLLAVARQLPRGAWLGRVLLLGALNFSVFWALLFVAAYRLPGGVAATVGAVQPLIVIALARAWLGSPVQALSIFAAVAGMGGVALLILTPEAALDPLGIAAGLGGAGSMAAGTVLTRKWQPPVPLLSFTAWQLTAGGLLLVPVALWVEPALPPLSVKTLLGLAHLGLIGAALSYALWFRGLARIAPPVVSTLGFLSPLTAVVLGWAVLGQTLSPLQSAGALTVLVSVWLGQQAGRLRPAPALKTGD